MGACCVAKEITNVTDNVIGIHLIGRCVAHPYMLFRSMEIVVSKKKLKKLRVPRHSHNHAQCLNPEPRTVSLLCMML